MPTTMPTTSHLTTHCSCLLRADRQAPPKLVHGIGCLASPSAPTLGSGAAGSSTAASTHFALAADPANDARSRSGLARASSSYLLYLLEFCILANCERRRSHRSSAAGPCLLECRIEELARPCFGGVMELIGTDLVTFLSAKDHCLGHRDSSFEATALRLRCLTAHLTQPSVFLGFYYARTNH